MTESPALRNGGVTNRTGARHGPREIRNQSSLMRKINQASGIDPAATEAGGRGGIFAGDGRLIWPLVTDGMIGPAGGVLREIAVLAISPGGQSLFRANEDGRLGVFRFVDGEIVYNGTPEIMANYATMARDAGARIIGGCCGTSPEHVAAMRLALDSTAAGAAPSLDDISRVLGKVTDGSSSMDFEEDKPASRCRDTPSSRCERISSATSARRSSGSALRNSTARTCSWMRDCTSLGRSGDMWGSGKDQFHAPDEFVPLLGAVVEAAMTGRSQPVNAPASPAMNLPRTAYPSGGFQLVEHGVERAFADGDGSTALTAEPLDQFITVTGCGSQDGQHRSFRRSFEQFPIGPHG